MMVYLLVGSLPWQGIASESVEAIDENLTIHRIGKKKDESFVSGSLLDEIPLAFKTYFEEVDRLEFDAEPNYSHLRRIMKELFVERGYEEDSNFVWLEEDHSAPHVPHVDPEEESMKG